MLINQNIITINAYFIFPEAHEKGKLLSKKRKKEHVTPQTVIRARRRGSISKEEKAAYRPNEEDDVHARCAPAKEIIRQFITRQRTKRRVALFLLSLVSKTCNAILCKMNDELHSRVKLSRATLETSFPPFPSFSSSSSSCDCKGRVSRESLLRLFIASGHGIDNDCSRVTFLLTQCPSAKNNFSRSQKSIYFFLPREIFISSFFISVWEDKSRFTLENMRL